MDRLKPSWRQNPGFAAAGDGSWRAKTGASRVKPSSCRALALATGTGNWHCHPPPPAKGRTQPERQSSCGQPCEAECPPVPALSSLSILQSTSSSLSLFLLPLILSFGLLTSRPHLSHHGCPQNTAFPRTPRLTPTTNHYHHHYHYHPHHHSLLPAMSPSLFLQASSRLRAPYLGRPRRAARACAGVHAS